MPRPAIDVDQLLALPNPLDRNRALLEAMDAVRELQAELGHARGLAVYEVYAKYGASRAAKLLGISRAGLYKVIAAHAPPEVKAARLQTLAAGLASMNEALAAIDKVRETTAEAGGTRPLSSEGEQGSHRPTTALRGGLTS